MRSSGTPISIAIRANRLASGSDHRCFVIAPRPPVNAKQGRPAIEEQLRAAFGDGRVVAAEHQDDVGLLQLVIHVVVSPDSLRQFPQSLVHRARRPYVS